MLSSIPPPKFVNHTLQFSNKPLREFEATHGIGWYRLYHCLDKHFPTCLRQEFFFPPLKLFPHPFFNVDETLFFCSTHQCWQTQILFKMANSRDTQNLLNPDLNLMRGVRAKKYIRLLTINFLTLTPLIDC